VAHSLFKCWHWVYCSHLCWQSWNQFVGSFWAIKIRIVDTKLVPCVHTWGQHCKYIHSCIMYSDSCSCLGKLLQVKLEHTHIENIISIVISSRVTSFWSLQRPRDIDPLTDWSGLTDPGLTWPLLTRVKGVKTTLSTQIVQCTWSGTLKNELSLPENWINYSGVLVGIRSPEQSWRQQAEPPWFSNEGSPTLSTNWYLHVHKGISSVVGLT